ncbi:hypothetical protein PMAYCL1PPCAC_22377, partial [Pristionchus mayeri]
PILNRFSSWESLPWPATKRIYCHLRTDDDCVDLVNLPEVSTHFRTGVKGFMKRDDNRPGIRTVHLIKSNAGWNIWILLYPSNLPFHALDALDAARFTRSGDSHNHKLEVTLNGPEDSVVEQVFGLLSTHIKEAWIDLRTSPDFMLCSQLLRKSTFGKLGIIRPILDDTTAPYILSLASLSKEIEFRCKETQLSDPAAFITQLDSTVSSAGLVDSSSLFFGLPHSFWKKFLNQKLASGTFDSIETGNMNGQKVMKAPFILPDTPLRFTKWYRKV